MYVRRYILLVYLYKLVFDPEICAGKNKSLKEWTDRKQRPLVLLSKSLLKSFTYVHILLYTTAITFKDMYIRMYVHIHRYVGAHGACKHMHVHTYVCNCSMNNT